MDIENFQNKRANLYHLTDSRNLESIVEGKKIYSTEQLAKLSSLSNKDKDSLLRERRDGHRTININNSTIYIRDQKPISLKALNKCLTDGWSTSKFIGHLNEKVFFWPTEARLKKHFKRYREENPIILKFSTKDLFEKNPGVEFCRLNSGATRANSFLEGLAPSRGKDTFQSAEDYKRNISSVAEVTFPRECLLPDKFWKSNSPEGPWEEVTI